MAFRRIVLALMAILLNLLTTGAALGRTVAVFQHDVSESALGFRSTGFLEMYLLILVFAVLFCLSMDYEVFLIRRMKECWDETGDDAAAVRMDCNAPPGRSPRRPPAWSRFSRAS
ncbi:MMPL family transporter [Nocardia sp. NPDC050412]|uniref:MMPL family transporter n=1 Tax=Nocardia sp. NPDC050412 TaxID=3364320 RepID=UPI0037BADF91